jgi:hypothetical protein
MMMEVFVKREIWYGEMERGGACVEDGKVQDQIEVNQADIGE